VLHMTGQRGDAVDAVDAVEGQLGEVGQPRRQLTQERIDLPTRVRADHEATQFRGMPTWRFLALLSGISMR
jgi:hypothetical protein